MSQALTPNNISTTTNKNQQASRAIVVTSSAIQRSKSKGLARSRSCSENQTTTVGNNSKASPSTGAMVVGYGTSLNNSSNIHQLMYNHHHQQQTHNTHNHTSNSHNHRHNHHHHHHHHHHQHYRRTTKFVTSPGLANSPPAREMDTFVAAELHHQLSNSCTLTTTNNNINGCANNNNIKNKTTTTTNHHKCDIISNHSPKTNHHQHHRHHTSGNKSGGRREPLTIEEYESKFRQSATDLVLIERIFAGSIACNQLRTALWPYLFGLILHRGRFEKVNSAAAAPTNGTRGNHVVDSTTTTTTTSYVFIEHEANYSRWKELREQYEVYRNQWESIQADQELRFSTFRERKSHIERDVVRCDRLHPFYAEQPQNLAKLTQLLMTYMMYDFDIGYVQGMSDIAAPILCMYQGDLVKTFWIFVEVMKLFRRNFELTQKTIHFQLDCLYKLIKNTDPVFAQYLKENDSSNCFFAFRAIVCQFKRELMKEDEDDYSNVLFLWDTIWCVDRRRAIQAEMDKLVGGGAGGGVLNGNSNGYTNQTNGKIINGTANGCRLMNGDVDHPRKQQTIPTHNRDSITNATTTTTSIPTTPKMIDKTYSSNGSSDPTNNSNNQLNNTYTFMSAVDIDQANSTRYKLTETEIFVLALCLSMIRRERDIIMAHKLDATDIHLHFINPKLANDLNGFIEHAISIYLHLKNEMDLTKLTSPKQHNNGSSSNNNNYHHNHYHQRLHEPQTTSDSDSIAAASPISTDGYDLLSDFLIIGGTSGSCMQIIG